MRTRLHSKYPALADQILASSPVKVRQVIVRAGQIALENAGLEAAFADDIRTTLEQGRDLLDDTRRELEERQRVCDDRYLEAQEAVEGGAMPEEAMSWFRKARAVAALLRIGAAVDPGVATEIVYEALFSAANVDAALMEVRSPLT